MKLVVFCVETDKDSQTDDKYIYKVVHSRYKIDNEITVKFAYMRGKGNFDKKFVVNQIKRFFSGDFDERYVVYCIDTDNLADTDDVQLNERIKKFCKEHGYYLVLFCRNIEEVFLHKKVDKTEKIEESNKFMKTPGFGCAKLSDLSVDASSSRKSNMLNVLDSIMERK